MSLCRPLHARWMATAVLVLGVATAAACTAVSRQSESDMGARAGQVMPFDLNATRHTFTKTEEGGVQEVVANDPTDARNIELIRSHLEAEAAQFRKGNFDDPAKIHGMEMPGLRELEEGAGRFDVRYDPLPSGGRISYASKDRALVPALHAWFDRQTRDHGMPGMGG